MSYSLTIRQGTLFKNKPGLDSLRKWFSSAVRIGGIGAFFTFEPEPLPPGADMEAAYMLFGSKGPMGRGFYLYVHKDFSAWELVTDLPTTTHDLEDFFTFAGLLASQLEAKELFENDDTQLPRAALTAQYAKISKINNETMKSYGVSRPGFAVSCVKMPLVLTEKLCERMGSVPAVNAEKFFSAYLSEMQSNSYTYMKPQFLRQESDGKPAARYHFMEGTATILPKEPFIPFGPHPFEGEAIENWSVAIETASIGTLGELSYADFIARLDERDKREFDAQNYITRAYSLKQLQLLVGAQ